MWNKIERKYYPYTNPTRIHPVPLIVRIRIGETILRGPVIRVELEEFTNLDLTQGTPEVTWQIYSDSENLGAPIITFSGEVGQIFTPDLLFDQTGFELEDGNVIGLTLTQNNDTGSLLPPFNEETGDLLDNKVTGEIQTYMYVFTSDQLEPLFTEDFSIGNLIPTLLSFYNQVLLELEETPNAETNSLTLDGFNETV